MCFALATLALQRRDERKAEALRPETPISAVSTESLEDVDKKTAVDRVQDEPDRLNSPSPSHSR